MANMKYRFQSIRAFIQVSAILLAATAVPAVHADESLWPDPSPIVEINTKVEDAHPNGLDWDAFARVLIEIKPGDELTVARLDSAEKALAPFAQVNSSVVRRANGVDVTFVLRPFRRIKSIDIDGAYPLFEKDVRNAMTVVSGDIFHPSGMRNQEDLVAQLYRAQGYVDPRVQIDWTQDPDNGHYQLYVNIHKGPYYILQKVRLHGNRSIGDDDILSRMATWRKAIFLFGSGRFIPQQLKDDVRKLTSFYREKGFADVKIVSDTSFDAQHHQVQCDLKIEEGPHYTIRFAGNHFYSDYGLRHDLVLFSVGNLGNIGLRRSIQNIRRRYLHDGFADVKVHWQAQSKTTDEERQIELTIEIEEGERFIVESVTIRGNAHLDTGAVTGQMLTRPPHGLSSGAYVADTLQEDMVAVESLYRNEGFLSVRTGKTIDIDDKTARVRVTLTIEEGPQTRVGRVSIEDDTLVAKERLETEMKLKSGKPYVPALLQSDENSLAAAISEVGYPHVQVKGTAVFSDDRTRADITYAVAPGPRVVVGRIFFLGNFRTRDRFMAREMGFGTGDPFNLKQVLEAQRNLRSLNIFDSVQVRTIGLKEDKDKVHLLVRALEKRPYYFEVGGGYQTDKGFYGRTKIGDHNFYGTGKDVSLSAEASQVGYRWEGAITDPRWLGTSIRASAGVYSERNEPFNQDFGTTTSGANVNFSRKWGRHYTNGIAVRYERRQQFLRGLSSSTASLEPQDLEPRTVIVTTPAVQYDSRDSFIRSRKGLLAGLSVDISKGLDSTLDDYLKYRLDLRAFRPLLQRTTLACRVYTGYIATYSDDAPPQDQLFFLGGTSTVRGYAENLLRYDALGNAVGGQLALAANLEVRVNIGGNFELIPFVDTGSVQQALVSAGDDDFRWSVGMGLQYITPIGPIGLFYGHKLDRRPGESSGQWHLSIGYTF